MNQQEFQRLPWLLLEQQVTALGYDRRTLAKLVDCGVLEKVTPAGNGHARYRKKQLAQLLEWPADAGGFAAERPLMSLKAVRTWTGFSEETLGKIVQAGGLRLVKPPGTAQGKYLKDQIAALIGI